MEDPNSPTNHGNTDQRNEPVRSRWTPKPEQILILESIFNSGMVNPPKDETVRIRKLLEKFGSVGDANVFYWFQNRRSRSRRRQRQMQATLAEEQRTNQQTHPTAVGAIQYELLGGGSCSGGSGGGSGIPSSSTTTIMGFPNSPSFSVSPSFLVGSSGSCGGGVSEGVESLFSLPNQMGFQEIEQSSSILGLSSDTSSLHYQTGLTTVFINGVATEVPRGPLDMRAMFGQDLILVHSSGVPVPVNEFGFLMHSLQHGESYFLVSRPT
ncbi:hypothetical protein JCGZ_02654 [Jatropha curcas]|uniref:Homeobox domain-containing protein n=1 Tax=Jatropha curcas TaxID=180498 RepID=A0A067L6C1_JATCU|nr:WUSCHEL-related homeobox 11 [Jatropha curcas]KDP39634.1 hypothetical protein JCGZ_02654 [Jatropha curcas]